MDYEENEKYVKFEVIAGDYNVTYKSRPANLEQISVVVDEFVQFLVGIGYSKECIGKKLRDIGCEIMEEGGYTDE